ncbi:MAG TPA: hypothetical protein VEI03_08015 [Stellaceae bacterium]|nr:hypothetical protein [Stellaceae bacterium]
MAVDGKWKIAMETPMGTRNATLTLSSAGGALTGSMSGDAGSIDIYDGKASGDQVSFKVDITQPMPLTLDFTATIAGDSLSGTVKLGMFGDASLSGTRA